MLVNLSMFENEVMGRDFLLLIFLNVIYILLGLFVDSFLVGIMNVFLRFFLFVGVVSIDIFFRMVLGKVFLILY